MVLHMEKEKRKMRRRRVKVPDKNSSQDAG